MNNLLLTLHSPIVQYTRNATFIYLSAILDQFHVLKTGRYRLFFIARTKKE